MGLRHQAGGDQDRMTVEQAQEIKVIASGGLKAACLELIPAFEQASGHRTKTVWAGSPNIMKRMQAGETVDLVVMALQSTSS